MNIYTVKQILMIARFLGYKPETVLESIEVLQCEQTTPSNTYTTTHAKNMARYCKPPLPMNSIIPCDKGNAYVVSISGKLVFTYYEYNNTYCVHY